MLLDKRGNPIRKTTASFEEGEARPVMQEVAGIEKDQLGRGFIDEILRFEDEILSGLPEGLKAYARLKRDDQVKSTLQQRRRALVSREWQVEPGGTSAADKSAAAWLEETLEHVGFDTRIDKMHWGIYYGYGVAELMYAADGQHVMIDAIRVRDRGRFRIDKDFHLRLLTPEDQIRGELMPERKFWYFTTGADHDDDPYGLGLAHYLYWPVLFKRKGVTLWLDRLEAAIRGSLHGTYQPGTGKAEQMKLLHALRTLRDGGSIIFPEGMGVESLEVGTTGTVDNALLFEKMNEAISKIVLSQTMTTDDGSSLSQAQVHEGVAERVERGDSDLLCQSFNKGTPFFEGPIQWLTEWNFPGANPPSVSFKFEQPEDLNQTAERDQKLYATGWERTEESIRETYGEGYQRRSGVRESGSPGPPPLPAEFSEGDEARDPAEWWGEELREAAGEETERWVDHIQGLLSESSTLTEFSEQLIEAYPNLSADAIAAVMRDAMMASHMAGRVEVDEDE